MQHTIYMILFWLPNGKSFKYSMFHCTITYWLRLILSIFCLLNIDNKASCWVTFLIIFFQWEQSSCDLYAIHQVKKTIVSQELYLIVCINCHLNAHQQWFWRTHLLKYNEISQATFDMSNCQLTIHGFLQVFFSCIISLLTNGSIHSTHVAHQCYLEGCLLSYSRGHALLNFNQLICGFFVSTILHSGTTIYDNNNCWHVHQFNIVWFAYPELGLWYVWVFNISLEAIKQAQYIVIDNFCFQHYFTLSWAWFIDKVTIFMTNVAFLAL